VPDPSPANCPQTIAPEFRSGRVAVSATPTAVHSPFCEGNRACSPSLYACLGATAASTTSILDTCGGHTSDYHFHQELSCCTNVSNAAGHSGQVGQGLDGRYLYGKSSQPAFSLTSTPAAGIGAPPPLLVPLPRADESAIHDRLLWP
jgi:hypothetical protein